MKKAKTDTEVAKDNKINILTQIIQDIFWMARRYAHGRHTYAPGIVREHYCQLKKIGVKIKHDGVIQPPDERDVYRFGFRSDWLDDINEEGE